MSWNKIQGCGIQLAFNFTSPKPVFIIMVTLKGNPQKVLNDIFPIGKRTPSRCLAAYLSCEYLGSLPVEYLFL